MSKPNTPMPSTPMPSTPMPTLTAQPLTASTRQEPIPSKEKAPLTPARRFALAFGVVYTLGGVAGFAATGLHDFAGPLRSTLAVFSVNPLHNCVHLVLGAVALAGYRRHDRSALVNCALGAILSLVTVLGFAHLLVILGIEDLGDPDNFLHLVSATLALYFGTIGADRLTAAPASPAPVAPAAPAAPPAA